MTEKHVVIETGDGPMPTFVVEPAGDASGSAILVYMDVFGPREELFDMCRRFAAAGHEVLLPNLFHRLGAPVFPPANVKGERVDPEAAAANRATSVDQVLTDTEAMLTALAEGAIGVRAERVGAIGYCMGGRHALAAAARFPGKVRAGLSVHGGQLVKDDETSPHLLVRELKVPFHFAFAVDDGTCPAEHQALIRAEAEKVGEHVTCELYPAGHGWSFPERWRYDHAVSERIWEIALDMFGANLK